MTRFGQSSALGTRAACDIGQINFLEAQRLCGNVCTREQKEVINECGQTLGLTQNFLQRFLVLFIAPGLAEGDLSASANDRDRSTQVMTRICGESLHLLKRILNALKHSVQRSCQKL